MLHFAYGSNMHRAVMRKHAPEAVPVGVACLRDYRFIITKDGYASVAPHPRGCVHGILWRLSPRDRITLDRWENIAAGLYRPEMLPVFAAGKRRRALVYVARARPRGVPRPGYMEIVMAAARECGLPSDYVTSLQRWLPKQPLAAGHRSLGEFG
jgi:cation transport regulator ChaC